MLIALSVGLFCGVAYQSWLLRQAQRSILTYSGIIVSTGLRVLRDVWPYLDSRLICLFGAIGSSLAQRPQALLNNVTSG